eukprot:CAMPEP_0174886200 /NCGR_PEP_ID=MMETSP0167-20121228/1458_1 /TAXON_ID=38298 /ORGANISM="Rhodella maculata, Strain CCMP736" /LENGTH=89 /DNA_ID=CAMNT_0016122101 /DNA_START=17 /DNA_END=283 /DNA_ORIENTATION=+
MSAKFGATQLIYPAALVDGLANHNNIPPEDLPPDGDHNGAAGVDDGLTTDEALGGVHGDAPHGFLAEVLGGLEDEADVVLLHFQRVKDR